VKKKPGKRVAARGGQGKAAANNPKVPKRSRRQGEPVLVRAHRGDLSALSALIDELEKVNGALHSDGSTLQPLRRALPLASAG
jgi:hypothetical protein